MLNEDLVVVGSKPGCGCAGRAVPGAGCLLPGRREMSGGQG